MEWEKIKIEETGVFSEDDISLFKEHRIENMSQLLSVTFGLTKVELFKSLVNGEEKLSRLKEYVLEKCLQNYREKKPYPMGLRLDEEE